MTYSQVARYAVAIVFTVGLGCSSRSVREPVHVEERTLDGSVGYSIGRDAVLTCVTLNDTKNLKRLIAEGQDQIPLRGSKEGWTFLHIAAQKGHVEAAELLIKNGADVNAKTDAGFTPLKIAEEQHQSRMIDLLHKHNAK